MKKWREKNKEKHNEYRRKYYEANKEKIKQDRKKYYEKQNLQSKKWREANKEYMKEYMKKYSKTPSGRKSMRIANWKQIGIIAEDFDAFYEKYINCLECEYCKKQFKSDKDRNLHHNHDITDRPNIRGILCTSCNKRDVYKNQI